MAACRFDAQEEAPAAPKPIRRMTYHDTSTERFRRLNREKSKRPGPYRETIIYTRYSRRPDTTDTSSEEAQLRLCREYCKKNRMTIVEEFGDRGRSGNDEDRPGLYEALRAVKRDFVLLVWRADRLARSVYLSEWIRRRVRKKHATIECVDGALSNGEETPEIVLVRQIMDAVMEFERKLISKRTSVIVKQHMAEGRIGGGMQPIGYMICPETDERRKKQIAKGQKPEHRRMVKDPDEQETLEIIRRLYEAGLGVVLVQAELDRMGRKPRGTVWGRESVRRWLHASGAAMRQEEPRLRNGRRKAADDANGGGQLSALRGHLPPADD